MTQHLVVATPCYITQVGDRLLTVKSGETFTPWDLYSNKSVIVIADDGEITLSYAGSAFIEGTPTDQWLAETITGRPSTPGPRGPLAPAITGGPLPQRIRVGLALAAVATRLGAVFPKEPAPIREHGIELLASGWTFTARALRVGAPPRTFLWTASIRGDDQECTTVGPRHRYRALRRAPLRSVDFAAIGSTVGVKDTLAAFRERYRTGLPELTDESAEEFLSEHIRLAASSPGGGAIGTDVMAITHDPFGSPLFRVRYRQDPARGVARQAFTPWVITNHMVQPPAVIGGSAPLHISWVPGTEEGEPVELIRYESIPPTTWSGGNILSSQLRRQPP
ncbi:hypothetical protein OEB99_17875 [Actinotalea sp. M2MS4P-6]|uniref:hypothetical protein n=1 Tax=Actinotalea sp. M2MS4P-6 TaxID=2983762 RepID=UPI0021E472C5|nr:hypothetical protein [Actinotalea sp. M2MS4P-6]MCV2396183.1 hypothetical protein [Actinotalea sp. M2MS4P-6]